MRNSYLLFLVLAFLCGLSSCKKSALTHVDHTPTCSGIPDLLSVNGYVSPAGGNQAELTRDLYGNIYTAGSFSGTINLGTTSLSGGGSYLSKTDATGKLIYARTINTGISYSINPDSLQNLYLCYTSIENPYHVIINLEKYDAHGNLAWAKQIPFNMDVFLPSVTVNNSGTVFMAVLNISNPIDSAYWAGYGSMFYAFDPNGNFIAKKDLSDNRFTRPVLTYAGGLYFILDSSASTIIKKLDEKGNTLNSKALQLNDGQHVYFDHRSDLFLFDTVSIKKLDAALNTIWQIKTPVFNSINSDTEGNLYISGNFTGTVNFDTGNGSHSLISKGSGDTYIEKIDAAGNFVWVMQSLGVDDKNYTASSSVDSFTVNQQGYIYVAGKAVNKNTGNMDTFIAAYKQCTK